MMVIFILMLLNLGGHEHPAVRREVEETKPPSLQVSSKAWHREKWPLAALGSSLPVSSSSFQLAGQSRNFCCRPVAVRKYAC